MGKSSTSINHHIDVFQELQGLVEQILSFMTRAGEFWQRNGNNSSSKQMKGKMREISTGRLTGALIGMLQSTLQRFGPDSA